MNDSLSRGNRGMKIVLKHVVACLFVFVMLVQLYLGIVQAVDSMDSGEIVQDYSLWSMRGNVSATQFSVGDTLKVLAVSDVASCYRLRIYRNASLVLDSSGDFFGSRAEAHVVLCPPQFGVGTYGVVLDVYCFNYPIAGTESSETKLAAFGVTSVETKLEAKAWFDSVFRNLNFEANLTDQYGYPVANETVEFGAKLFDRQRPTDGWYPLGQAKSDSNGKVSYGLAFQTGGCGYPLKACHRANDNFGESFCEFQAETAPNWTLAHSMAMQLEEAGSKFSIASEPLGWFRIGLNTTDPNAMLPFKFSAEYWIDQPLSGEFVGFSFYRDEVSLEGWFSLCMASYNGSCYSGDFVWSCPNVTGNHRFYVGVWHGNVNNITMARYGLGLHDCTSRDVFISLCPTNMVVQVAGATSTNYWPVLVAFSKPRLYESAPTSFFVSSTLAPKFKTGGVDYVIDDPVGNVSVTVYLNSTHVVTDRTNREGFVELPYPLFMCAVREVYNVTAVVADEGNLLYGKRYVQWVNFTKLTVHDSKTGGSDVFRLNCTVQGSVNGTSVYVATNNTIEAKAEVCGKTLPNLSLTTVVARRVSVSTTGDRGNASVPVGADYLRVVEQLDPQPLTSDQHLEVKLDYGGGGYRVPDSQDCVKIPMLGGGQSGSVAVVRRPFVGDVNHDGQVNALDLILVAGLSGKKAGDPGWNPNADLNGDGTINILDLIIVAGRLGSHEWVKSKIEFLKVCFENVSATGNLGTVSEAWCPSETGTYLVQVKAPATLIAYVAAHCNVTDVYACLNRIRYYDVIKRPVSLSLDMPGKVYVERFGVAADTYVCSFHENTNYGGFDGLYVGDEYEVYSGPLFEHIGFVRFDVSSIPVNSWVMSARIGLWCHLDYATSDQFEFHRASCPWNESTVTWNSKPSWDSTSTYDFTVNYGYWKSIFINVTQDIRAFVAGAYENFGWAVRRKTHTSACMLEVRTRENWYAEYRPYVEVVYTVPEAAPTVSAYDGVARVPIGGLSVQFLVNGTTMGMCSTNSSGVAQSSWRPSENRLYNVTTASFANATFEAGRAGNLFDFRFPTNVTSPFGNSTTAAVGYSKVYHFNLTSFPFFTLRDKPVRIHVNGTYSNGTHYVRSFEQMYTDWQGHFSLSWAAPANGTYVIRAVYEGSFNYSSCVGCLTVVAVVIPLAIQFGISPIEFEPGDNVTLGATVKYASNNSAFVGYRVDVLFTDFMSNGTVRSACPLVTTNQGTGTTGTMIKYPVGTVAHAYAASIVPNYGLKLPQGIVTNPIQLTVSQSTRILLNVTRDPTSLKHTICGWLKWKNNGVYNKTVAIKLDETTYTARTNQTGYFSLDLDLKPKDNNATTYTITATFEDAAQGTTNATAWAYTPDGSRYAACTTVQYNGYKPSVNTTSLTVDPRATGLMTTKSPEQLQKEAEQNGTLTIWHEFSWWYPWYRMHIQVSVNPAIHLGLNPILPGGETAEWNGLEFFNSLESEIVQTIGIEALGLIGTYLAAKYLSLASFVAGIIAEGAKIGLQILFLIPSWNSAEAMLASALMSIVMMIFAMTDFGSTASNILVRFIDGVKWRCGGAVTALTWILMKLKDMFLWGRGASSAVVDLMEIIADAVLAIAALRRSIELLHMR